VDLESLILGAPASGPPRAYIKLMNDLVPALRESVELDRSGASELKVRAEEWLLDYPGYSQDKCVVQSVFNTRARAPAILRCRCAGAREGRRS